MIVHHDSRPSVHSDPLASASAWFHRTWRCGMALAMALSISGCGDDPMSATRDGMDPNPRTVVSLSPAITTTMLDLGQSERLVGRTPWCRGIDDRPVVGTLEGVDAEILVALRPSVVLHQPPATGTDPVLLGLQERLDFELGGGRLDGVEDLLDLLDQIEALGLADEAGIDRRRRDLEAIGERMVSEDAPRAVLLHSIDTVGVAGEDTFLGELGAAAGLRNAAGPGGWREWSLEMLLSAEVDVVVVFTNPAMEPQVRERFDAIEWPRTPTLVVITNPDAFEPSTRMPDVLAEIRGEARVAGVDLDESPTVEVGGEVGDVE